MFRLSSSPRLNRPYATQTRSPRRPNPLSARMFARWHRRSYIPVTEQLLHGANVGAVLEQAPNELISVAAARRTPWGH